MPPVGFEPTIGSRRAEALGPAFSTQTTKRTTYIYKGHAVAQLVEALRYKPERRGFDSRWCH